MLMPRFKFQNVVRLYNVQGPFPLLANQIDRSHRRTAVVHERQRNEQGRPAEARHTVHAYALVRLRLLLLQFFGGRLFSFFDVLGTILVFRKELVYKLKPLRLDFL